MKSKINKKKSKYIYLELSNDKYELPLCVVDSVNELIKLSGASKDNICHSYRNYELCKNKHPRFIRVKVDEI